MPDEHPPHSERSKADGVLVLCAGRHAVEVIDALIACGILVHGCLDARIPQGTEIYPGVTVIGTDRDLRAYVADGFTKVYLGIGGLGNLDDRIRLLDQLAELSAVAPTLIHPTAHVAPTASLERGTTILARASVGPLSTIGFGSIITQNAVVTHHCVVGRHVVIAPNAVLAASVHVGDESTVGMGVTVYHDVRVGRRVTIVNGANVMVDVPDGATVKHQGVPTVVRSGV